MRKISISHGRFLVALIPLFILGIVVQTRSQNPGAVAKPNLRTSAATSDMPVPVNISNSSSHSSEPWVGVDGNGFAYAVWYEHLDTRTFYFSTNKSGAWSTPVMIEKLNYDTEESGWPVWAVSPSGSAHLTFFDAKVTTPTGLTYDVFDRTYENGAWGQTMNVSSNNVQNQSIYPGMAINPVDNYAYVIWSDHNGSPYREIKYRYRKADGTWVPTPYPPVGSRDTILPVGNGDIPRIAVDGAGTAHMVWGYIHGRTIWYSKNRTPQIKTAWTSPLLIKADAGNEWSNPIVTCDNAGNAYVLWMDGPADWDGGDPYNPNNPRNSAEIFIRTVNSDGTLGWGKNVSQSAAHSYYGTIAVHPVLGDLVVAWTEKGNIFANALIGGTWTGPGNVTNNSGNAESTMPRVAIDASGRAHLVYARAASGGMADIMYMSIAGGAVQVLTPNGGEVWTGGSSQTIHWTAPPSVAAVKIELSTNNGANYQVVAAAAPNTGSFAWTVPNTASNHCRIKVSEASTGTPADVSDAVFSIVSSSVPVAISGTVTADGTPLADVVMYGLPGNPATNASGQYSATVSYGWTGTVTPSKNGYVLSPSSRSYSNITTDQLGQDYIGSAALQGVKNDFNGDGQADILWRNTATGENYLWYMGPSVAGLAAGLTVDSKMFEDTAPAKVFEKDEDIFPGKPALIYTDPRDGSNPRDRARISESQVGVVGNPPVQLFSTPFEANATILGLARIGEASVPSMTDFNWQLVGTGDFNGDARPDIVWRNSVTGENGVWYMNGGTRLGAEYMPSVLDLNWQIVGAADFNGDGKPDILWRNAATGENYIWYMNGVNRIGGDTPPSVTDVNWQIVGTGDFSGDGMPDILWHNTATGENYIWYMDGGTRLGGDTPPMVMDLNWQIVGVGDFNGDGKIDILWRNSVSGENGVWYMNGGTRLGAEYLLPVADLNWKIVNR